MFLGWSGYESLGTYQRRTADTASQSGLSELGEAYKRHSGKRRENPCLRARRANEGDAPGRSRSAFAKDCNAAWAQHIFFLFEIAKPALGGSVGNTTAFEAQPYGGSTIPFEAATFPPKPTLIERYTFENFVVGPCNQFAHAASKAVATRPSGSYNPLFIYGGTGIGKTHLMHAIGLALGAASPGTRIVYTSSERFVNDMVTCIKTERMPSFHSYYRSADVLLSDDIHIIAGKGRTREGVFHTVSDLYEHKKQIVISSDSAPHEITGLVERLRSRFEWGLMVDMQPPISRQKWRSLTRKPKPRGSLSDDVRIFIATKTKSSVRELEGALVRVLACSSMNHAPVTPS